MNIPNFENTRFVDENGKLTNVWQQILIQLITELQNNASNEGYRIPQQTTTNINKLTGNTYNGNILYDKDTHEFKVVVNGALKVIQVA